MRTNNIFKKIVLFVPDIIVLILIGLIPMLWFSTGELVMGHDSGWTLVPEERFFDRLSAWTGFEFGGDQALYIGSVTIYALPALLSLMDFSMYTVQRTTYVFWFLGIATSMYIAVVTMLKTRNARLIALSSALFYAVNHYTLQAWSVAELSKFSIMILFPVTLTLFWNVLQRRIKLRYALIIFALTSLIFNGGGGSGIPLYAGMLLSLGIFCLYVLLILKRSFRLLLKTLTLFVVVFVCINAYWILPMVSVIQSQYSPFAESGGAQGAIAWTNVISANTSIINLLRLQGFSSWYDSPNHAFAYEYLNNPIIIFGSYIFSSLALLSFFFIKTKQEKSFLLFIFLVFTFSLIFVGGTHPPFGFIYEWLMKNIFGFAIFRTAFYKFGYALWFTVGILSSYTFMKMIEKLHVKEKLFGIIIFFTFISFYHNQFFTGIFFNILGDFKTKIYLTSDIENSKNFVKTLPDDTRIILLPPPSPINGQTDVYKNGYFSRTPLPFQISQKSIVSNRESNTPSQENMTESFYMYMANNNFKEAKNVLSELGVTHLLLRKNVLLNHKTYRVENPEVYERKLKNIDWISLKKDFGDWKIYEVKNPGSIFSASSPDLYYVSGEESVFIKNFDLTKGRIFIPEDFKKEFSQNQNLPFVLTIPCETCEYPGIKRLPTVEDVKLLPTSPFYFLSQIREENNLKNSKENEYLYFGYLFFYAEKHSVEIILLASQYFDIDILKLDQQQRYDIVKKYTEMLKESFTSFKQLPIEQQISLAKEYKTSLETQRDRLRGVRQSNFFKEIFSSYYDAYSILNNIISSDSLRKAIDEKDSSSQYRLDIPKEGLYHISTTVKGGEYRIDGEIVEIESLQNLARGMHVLKEEKVHDFVHQNAQIELNSDNPLYEVKLENLEPSEVYGIQFSYHIDQGSAIRFEVVNDLGIDIANLILEHSSRSYWIPFENFFRTSNYIGGAYKIRIYAEGEEDLEPLSYIQNLSVELLKLPYVFVEKEKSPTISNLPKITSKKISQSEYEIDVKNATNPYVLNFKQTFSPFWKAYIFSSDKKIIHFPYNLTFNGWYIEEEGDYKIKLRYNVDFLFQIGIITTGLTIIAIAGAIVIFQLRKNDKKS